jgi:ParB-like chromosome segregation protein Spo0J
MMTGSELQALANDIKANGLRQQVVYFVTRRGERQLLDGRNRLAACKLARMRTDWEGREVREGEVDPYDYVISANIRRRHLNTSQKRRLIEAVLKANPARTNRETAKLVGVDDKTVAAARADAEARSEIPHVAIRLDSRGRRQSATKKRGSSKGTTADTETAPAADTRLAANTDRGTGGRYQDGTDLFSPERMFQTGGAFADKIKLLRDEMTRAYGAGSADEIWAALTEMVAVAQKFVTECLVA